MGGQSGYVRSAAGDDGNTSGQNEIGQIHNDHGQSHLENEDVQNDHCYKNHVQSHRGCKFHSFFSFLMSMATITKLQMSC